MSVTELVVRAKEEYGRKGLKFLAVSAFNVVFGQSLLLLAQLGLSWSGTVSNMFAVAVSALPAYLLSRYWVWQKRGPNHFFKEVVPFWSLAFAGFVLSTAAVAVVESTWDVPPLVINLVNLSAFGVLWVAKFFILDKVLFRHEHLTDDPLDAFLDEAHGDRHS